jgi:hypothetical protein
VAYGARLESVLGASPRGFESPILRGTTSSTMHHHHVPKTHRDPERPVSTVDSRSDVVVRVRPKISLLRNGLVAVLVAGTPIFIVLYWFAYQRGTWMTVLALHLVCLGLCSVFVWRHRAGYAEVRDGVFRKQAFSARTSVPVASIDRIVLAETYRGHSTETVPQLLALDADGRRVMRMRGHYWTADDMRRIAEATGARVTVEPHPLPSEQFYSLFEGTAYWYEGKPWMTITAIAVALGVGVALMLMLMHLLGMDLAGRG